jgi:glycosyltransferase involved in cell wall biosynthesis
MRLLHVHARFDPLGEAMATVQFIRALPAGVDHSVVAAEPIAPEAQRAAGSDVTFPENFPALGGPLMPARLHRIGMAMRDFDLVLTHGPNTLDVAMAATLLAKVLALPPVLHHEDLLDATDASRRRTWYRRIALGRAAGVVVPSVRLEALALGAWQQPRARVHRIAPGAVQPAKKPRPDALPRLIKREGERWLGSIGALTPEGGAEHLVQVLAALPEAWQLVLVGEGPAGESLRAQALQLGLAHRVHLVGLLTDPLPALGLFDLFAKGGEAEMAPALVAAAMAAGVAFAAPRAGDLDEWLGEGGDEQLCASDDEAALAALIGGLARDDARRRALGEANRLRAAELFEPTAALAARREACAAALGTARFP